MTHMNRALAVLVSLGCLAGCGAEQPAATLPSPLSKAEYIAAVDKLCEAGNAVAERYEPRWARLVAQGADDGEAAQLLAEILDKQEPIWEQIRQVEPAPNYRDQAREYLRAVELARALQRRLVAVLERGDEAEADIIGRQLRDAQVARDAAARAFGFERCGNQGSAP